jgi:hypothetical protein
VRLRDEPNNPTLSARNKEGAIGPFLVPDEAVVWTNPPRFDKFVWNEFGQPKAGPERSEG